MEISDLHSIQLTCSRADRVIHFTQWNLAFVVFLYVGTGNSFKYVYNFTYAVSQGTVLSTWEKNRKRQPVCICVAQKIDIYLYKIF